MSGLHQPQRNLLHLYHGRGETWLQPTVDVNANAVKDAGLDTIAAPGAVSHEASAPPLIPPLARTWNHDIAGTSAVVCGACRHAWSRHGAHQCHRRACSACASCCAAPWRTARLAPYAVAQAPEQGTARSRTQPIARSTPSPHVTAPAAREVSARNRARRPALRAVQPPAVDDDDDGRCFVEA